MTLSTPQPPIKSVQCLFKLENVNVSYTRSQALNDISLNIHEGETVALIGPSGAGKTTLLNKLYGMQARHCAFVHQQYALVPQLSVFHNIYIGQLDRRPTWYNLINLIKPRQQILDEIHPIVDTLGLRDKLFAKVETLSGGQQQRVAVGRAMYHGGRVLLADEPVSSIDARQGEAVLRLIVNAGKTVVMALHSVGFALRFGQRIVGLCAGRIKFDLPTGQVTPQHIDTLYATC